MRLSSFIVLRNSVHFVCYKKKKSPGGQSVHVHYLLVGSALMNGGFTFEEMRSTEADLLT